MLKNIYGVKKVVGINSSSCDSCIDFGTEDDCNFPEMAVSWPVCHRFYAYQNLKSFPFKKAMKCWFPEFWASKFTKLIKEGTHKEVLSAIDEFNKAIEAVENI